MSDTAANYLPSSNDPAGWFAVFTIPRHEKKIEQHFRVRRIESFLPLCRTQRQWKDGSRRTLELPLFANYIFVRIDCGGRVRVLEVPGVISIVGGPRKSLSVPDSYIDFLREGLKQGKIEPHPYLTAGTNVRICSGVLSGAEGVLLRKKNNFRVVITLEMIMKSVAVEVGIHDIEPVGRSCCAYVSQLAG